MIEDKELRELFKIESAEHLQKLDDGLLRLEKEPAKAELVPELLREAHSLKGAARMLGLSEIETLSHRLEDMLNAAKKGTAALTPETIDRMYKTLDTVKKLVQAAITEETSKDILDFGSRILDLKEKPTEAEATSIGPEGQSKIQNPKSKIEGEAFRIETVRVDTKKLDALMTQAGELNVTKRRIAHGPAAIEKIIGLWEEANKSAECEVRNAELKTRASTLNTPHSSLKRDSTLRTPHSAFERLGILLAALKKEAAEDSSRLESVSNELEDGIRTIRLLPMSTIFNLFPRMVRDMAKAQSKEAELIIEGGETGADKQIIEELKDPLMHMIRNAVDHGIEAPSEREQKGKPRTGSILLKAYQAATNIVIEVTDDGQGLDLEAIKRTALKKRLYTEEELAVMTVAQLQAIIFASGFSTSSFVTDVSGRGVGLDVVRNNVERLKGNIRIEAAPGSGCTLRIHLPITLATTRVLITAVNNMSYAVPVEHVQTTIRAHKSGIFNIEGRETIVFEGRPISVARLSELLEIRQQSAVSSIQNPKSEIETFPCIIISIGEDRLGLLVDELLDEQEVVLKPQGIMLKRVRNVTGSAILGTGEVCMVLNPKDLIKTVSRGAYLVPTAADRRGLSRADAKREDEIRDTLHEIRKAILYAEDSLTTRAQVKRILEGAGYEVVAVADGMEAFNRLGAQSFDALVTDILMPNMDGLTLTQKVRQDRRYKELPIILVTSLASDEDRKRGLESGANAYITKPAFDQKVLLDTLKRLI